MQADLRQPSGRSSSNACRDRSRMFTASLRQLRVISKNSGSEVLGSLARPAIAPQWSAPALCRRLWMVGGNQRSPRCAPFPSLGFDGGLDVVKVREEGLLHHALEEEHGRRLESRHEALRFRIMGAREPHAVLVLGEAQDRKSTR